jgi:hypothetical protein
MMRTATFNGRESSCAVRIGAIQAACSLPREELARREVRNGCERRGFSLYEVSHEQKPTDDPRQRTDWKTTKQTDEPWKAPVEKEQQGGAKQEDLEKWHDSNTH